MNFHRKKKKINPKHWNKEIAPDEIFLDSKNLPQFNTQQFEGRIERPIGEHIIVILGMFFLIVGILFVGRVWFLQIAQGDTYAKRSENNRLEHIPIFAKRGIIFDKNKNELAWNMFEEGKDIAKRVYIQKDGFGHVLGYVSYPSKDSKGFFYQEEFEGKNGVEKKYNDLLAGQNGIKLIEVNALGVIQSESFMQPPSDGRDLELTVDGRIQEKLYELIKQTAEDRGFVGGAGVVMDIHSGEILALTNFPEYSPKVLSDGDDDETISGYINSEKKPFLNRAVGGLYTPGSIVKPFIAIGALNEHIIDPDKKILSTGSISIPNPFLPDVTSIFMDWKAHGWVNMREALGVSSNVYFYAIGGGYEDQRGLGIVNIGKYTRMFGLGQYTGVDMSGEEQGTIPSPEWKEKNFNGEVWRIGDTYHTAIGQYGFQVTPIQIARAIGAIARGGVLVTPHILSRVAGDTSPVLPQETKIDISGDYFTIVREGMRNVILGGTGSALNTFGVTVAAKTGTAELGVTKKFVNSWVTGFFPYENPKYSFAIVMEHGSRENLVGASYVMRNLLDWMVVNTPEYVK
ncbi:MAG: penicillin-binding transpeptidase domain-containing protein [bacterium]|nr:penicillin-binding transpeptidase domain-containing protein [bacterium]